MKITLDLSEKSVTNAIRQLAKYRRELESKTRLLAEGLAMIGVKEASIRFATAMYDGTNDVEVGLERIKDGWAIVAKGQAVCFLEFGAGVYYNTVEPYPNPRPDGVVGIGEYGENGKRTTWVYYDEAGNKVFTHGNPAVMGMWYATEEMRRSILDVAREVFP